MVGLVFGRTITTATPRNTRWTWYGCVTRATRRQTLDRDDCASFGTATRSVYIGDQPKVGQVKKGGASDYAAACPNCDVRRARACEQSA